MVYIFILSGNPKKSTVHMNDEYLTSLHSAMESKGIPLRRQSRDDSNERAATIAKCIICQTQTDQTTTTSQRGRKRVAEAAEIRNDSVCKRLKDVIGQEFVYHVTNECYKSYTHKKTLEALRNLPGANIATSSCSTIDEMDISVAATRSQSSSSNRDPPSSGVDMYKQSCTICGAIKHHGSYEKFRISESHRAEQFLQATSFFQDDVYTRTCDLQDTVLWLIVMLQFVCVNVVFRGTVHILYIE